jgi:hypothetical protein
MRINFNGPWPFDDGTWENHIAVGPGVYRLRAWDSSTNESRPIQRAGGTDAEGVLDIGESKNLWGRLTTMRRAMRNGNASHSAGLKFHGWGFADVFPLDGLMIDFVLLPTKDHAVAAEAVAIADYLWRFKDLPPLNSTKGNRKKTAKWIKSQGQEAYNDDYSLNIEGLLPDGVLVVGP